MEQAYEYESSIGGGGDPSSDYGWDIGIDQFSYRKSDRAQFNQSHAAYEGKKLYSENLRKYEDAERSGDNFKPTNHKFDDITFRTSFRNSNDCHTTDNTTSKSSSSTNDHCATYNNPSESSSDKQNHPKQEQKKTSQAPSGSCKPETKPTKNNSTLFFDPKRIFADINTTKHEALNSDQHDDSSDTQSEGELLDLREQTLRFDAEMKKKLGAPILTPDSSDQHSVRKMKTKGSSATKENKCTSEKKPDNSEEKRPSYKRNEKCSCPLTDFAESLINDVHSTFPATQEEHFTDERKRDYEDDKQSSSKKFEFMKEQDANNIFGRETKHGDVFDQKPPPQSSNPSDKSTSEPSNSKRNARTDSEGYSKPKKKSRSKTQSQQQQNMPDNTGRSNRGGRSRSRTNAGNRGWNQEARWPNQMEVDDERRDVNMEEDVREEAADGSGDALQQLFFGILKALVWFLSFLFFLFLVLLSFAINIARKWFGYTMVFLKMIGAWIRGKGMSQEERNEDSSPTLEDIQQLLNLGPPKNIELPKEGEGAVQRLLACSENDPYEVLGVTSDATDEDIKKYYRKQCIMVHPDKNRMTGAEEAFKILGSAFEIIGDPIKRAQYHQAITEYAQKEMFHKEFAEQFKKMKELFEERANTIQCLMCGGKHLRYLTDRPSYAARYCATHDTRHGATDGDIWAESTHLGFRWHYYTCTGDEVYDITDWAKCQNMRLMRDNAHEVRYRFDLRQQRHRPPPQPNFDEQDFWEELLRQTHNMDRSTTRNQSSNPGSNSGSNTNTHQRKHRKKHRKKKKF